MAELSGHVQLVGECKTYDVVWQLKGEVLTWELGSKTYRIHSNGNLEGEIQSFLKHLGKKVLREQVELEACMKCTHFFMSGMGRDMGRGQRGTCNLHSKGVEVCYCCSNFERKE